MTEIKCYIIGHSDGCLTAWVDDSGKDKPVRISGPPDDTPPGSIVSCDGYWKFNRGEGYSFLSQKHKILKRGNGGSITIKSDISRLLHIYGIGINGIWISRRQESDGATLLTSDGVNKITVYGNKRNEIVRFTPLRDTDYTLEVRNKCIFLTYRITDAAGNVITDYSISYAALACALLIPLAGLVSACAYYSKGNRIAAMHSVLTSYLSWFAWAIVSALSGLNVSFTSLLGAAWALCESYFMQ